MKMKQTDPCEGGGRQPPICDQSLDFPTLLIPSYEPDEALPKLISELISLGVPRIVVVNDGSDNRFSSIFEHLSEIPEVYLLTHDKNKGKGAALKTGFKFILDNFEQTAGVVTCDADGQHSPDDIINVCKTLFEKANIHEELLILGTRDFLSKDIPIKSRFGNLVTTGIFFAFYGKIVKDTQTGLRGLSLRFVKECLNISGDRFDYEIKMLIEAVKKKVHVFQVDISTIYINSNRATHFRAIVDSLRIYKIIFAEFFRYSISGLLSAILDILIFALITKVILFESSVLDSVFWGTVIARYFSSLFNFTVNRNFSFKSNAKFRRSLWKYYLLCVLQMITSWLLVVSLFNKIGGDTTILKILVDFCLFFISYQIQQRWVFKIK